MEGAGLALALLPLVLNQLDNYVQGLEVLGDLRNSRYRRKLDSYLTKLGAEQALFIITMKQALQDFPDYKNTVDSHTLTLAQLNVLWEKPTLQSFLESRLGTNYPHFLRTMNKLSELLIDLQRKLGWENLPHEVPWNDTPKFKRQLQKIKDVFRKSVYKDLFSEINLANQHLQRLVEQSTHFFMTQYAKKPSLKRLQQSRRFARSLHSTIVKGQYWKCVRPDEHAICFPLSSPSLYQPNNTADSLKGFHFSVMISCSNPMEHLNNPVDHPAPCLQCHRVCIESKLVEHNPLHQNSVSPHGTSIAGNPSHIRLPTSQSTATLPIRIKGLVPSPGPISDICLALSNAGVESGEKTLGYIQDGELKHIIHRSQIPDPYTNWRKSLATLLGSSCNIMEAQRDDAYFFSQRDRLRLAVKLACSVLELHGSWLQSHWQASDIIFLEPPSSTISHPYVEWGIGSNSTGHTMCQERPSTALVRSKILFPLAIVLVELSLGENLDLLRTTEDEDQKEANSDYKAAIRLLKYVGLQSGPQYQSVVEKCLFWSDTEVASSDSESSLETEGMQDEAFYQIVLPLVDNLNSWERTAQKDVLS
ncbi:hypothetical protein N7540_005419 [Penicillium herquei]|nr:hypothetical protein N7540_005419 [Penicillium herquei]